ncbi:MAG: sialate O-acetylesterase [Bacteroidetes bacterium]|nr:sialate O-acetylesterase [Bacteroidota bacterium]MBT7093861.1 sialate O-acetylesterase [Bacteroidota bacterium]
MIAKEKPVKVYIMIGQSNMIGFGRINPDTVRGTLSYLCLKEGKYPHLLDYNGKWVKRKDVWYVQTTVGQRQHWLQPKDEYRHIGPELQFGHIVGQYHEEMVLIIKAAQGNRSIGWDILPPGSQRFTYDGRTYAGYNDSTPSWIEGQPKKPVNWYAGKQYDDFVSDIHMVLDSLQKYFPDYKHQGYEIAGFVWWQGHKDQNPAHASRYELNLVKLINSIRNEFKVPDAPFVLATIAFEGWKLANDGLTVANAQLAVSGERGKYPEFYGKVKTVEVRDFWRDKARSPSAADYHYNHNAETHIEVGDKLGKAMVELQVIRNTKDK